MAHPLHSPEPNPTEDRVAEPPAARSSSCSGIALVGALLAALLAACAGGTPDDEFIDPSAIVIPLGRPGERPTPELAAFEPAFAALGDALEAHDDALARRVLDGILARGPEGRALEVARIYDKILRGRALLESVAMELELRPVDGDAYAFDVVLVVRNRSSAPLVLRTTPPSLNRLSVGVTPEGVESRRRASVVAHALEELVLPASGELEVRLGRDRAAIFGMLALRERWWLETRNGEVEVDGDVLPALATQVVSAEDSWLAPFLPTEPVEPSELVRYASGPEIFEPPLMERAVRIDPARRGEALELLAEAMREWDDVRVLEVVPALRWLARAEVTGAELAFWRRWSATGILSPAGPEQDVAPSTGLVLPNRQEN